MKIDAIEDASSAYFASILYPLQGGSITGSGSGSGQLRSITVNWGYFKSIKIWLGATNVINFMNFINFTKLYIFSSNLIT